MLVFNCKVIKFQFSKWASHSEIHHEITLIFLQNSSFLIIFTYKIIMNLNNKFKSLRFIYEYFLIPALYVLIVFLNSCFKFSEKRSWTGFFKLWICICNCYCCCGFVGKLTWFRRTPVGQFPSCMSVYCPILYTTRRRPKHRRSPKVRFQILILLLSCTLQIFWVYGNDLIISCY